MDGLELVMDQAGAHQLRDIRWGMDELFQGIQSLVHLIHWRRDNGGALDGAARRSDPILAAAKFARSEVLPAHAFHQYPMHLPDQAQADRQGLRALQAVIQGAHVVVHLTHIGSVFKKG